MSFNSGYKRKAAGAIVVIGMQVVMLAPCLAEGFAIDDGFPCAQREEGKHFQICYSAGVNGAELPHQLNIGASDALLAGTSRDSDIAAKNGLARMSDILFLRVGDILDMHLYSFKGNIKICRTQKDLQQVYNRLYTGELPDTGYSFYMYDTNTIYISAENFRVEILGHEIGHSIISNYFVVQPPVKVQEVLAGYVEYQLRKAKR